MINFIHYKSTNIRFYNYKLFENSFVLPKINHFKFIIIMKYKILIIASLFSSLCWSQSNGFKLIRKINGIEIFAKLSKTKESSKKDTWVIEFEYINNSGTDIFYKSRFVDPKALLFMGDTKKVEVANFAVLSLENTKAISFISDKEMNLNGDKTRLKTDENESIYIIKKGKTYTRTMDFRADKGVEPIIVVQAVNSVSFTGSVYDFM